MNYKKVEKVIKGFSNHRRIQILHLLKEKPELSVAEISDYTKADYKAVSQHVLKMEVTGLVTKRHDINSIRHRLTNLGQSVLQFCRIVE